MYLQLISNTPLEPLDDFFSFVSWFKPNTAESPVPTLEKSAETGRYCFIRNEARLIILTSALRKYWHEMSAFAISQLRLCHFRNVPMFNHKFHYKMSFHCPKIIIGIHLNIFFALLFIILFTFCCFTSYLREKCRVMPTIYFSKDASVGTTLITNVF